MTEALAFAIWLILLALAFPYVRLAKHPRVKTLAAFIVMLFSVVSATLFFALSWAAAAAGWTSALTNVLWVLLFLALIFVPAFLAARWLKRPPLERPVPK